MQVTEIHVTCPDAEVASAIADALVGARLAACANTTGPIESRYWWQGSIETESEVLLVLKTRAELVTRVEAAVADLHPYDVPSIVGHHVSSVNTDYERWVYDSTIAP